MAVPVPLGLRRVSGTCEVYDRKVRRSVLDIPGYRLLQLLHAQGPQATTRTRKQLGGKSDSLVLG